MSCDLVLCKLPSRVPNKDCCMPGHCQTSTAQYELYSTKAFDKGALRHTRSLLLRPSLATFTLDSGRVNRCKAFVRELISLLVL